MRVGVLTGLAAEARLLTNVLFDGKAELRIVRTGADPERARREAEDLVDAGVSALVSFGVAGGLCPSLDAGDLILADRVILADGRAIAADAAWVRLARQRLGKPGHKTVIGPVAASSRLLVTPAEKRQLCELSAASPAIWRAARSLPWPRRPACRSSWYGRCPMALPAPCRAWRAFPYAPAAASARARSPTRS
jgi:hypothetical protein